MSRARQRGQSFTPVGVSGEDAVLRVRVQREDAVCEPSPSLFPSACSGPAARLTQRQEASPPAGKAAGQGRVNHQSKINTSDDPVGKGGNETPAFERNILRRDLFRPFLAMY